MTGSGRYSAPHVNDPRGPVHTGPGDMYVTMLQQAGIDAARTAGSDPRRLAEDYLRWRARRFVAPDRLGDARDTLLDRHLVMLTGDPGVGRHCAAAMLLHELRETRGSFHELLDQSEEESSGRALDPGHVGDGDRLLLDLVHLADHNRRAVLKELDGFLATVRERGAYMAVVLPSEEEASVPPEHLALTVRVGRPDGREVLLRHLHQEGIHPSDTELALGELPQFLERESMERIGALALRIRRARQREGEHPGFGGWLRTAVKALSPSDTEVAKWLADTGEGPQRALLLTTAFLHGARPDTVHRAAHTLVELARHPQEDTPLLAHEPLATRLRAVHASTGDGGRVFLEGMDYDQIVRTHGWNNFPAMRPTLRAWVAQIATAPWLAHDERAGLVRRFTEQWLRTERPEELRELPENWAKHQSERLGRPSASQLLRVAVLHERHGGHFRRMLYDWSCDSKQGPGLAHVLIGICETVLLTRYPDQAMIRLRHLARNEHLSVRESARVALTSVTRDDRLHWRLMERLQPDSPRYGAADSELFLHLAEPARLLTPARRGDPLIASASVRAQLAAHWHAVRRRAPAADWSSRELSWLDAARVEGPHSELLLDVLVDSCEGDATAASRLYVVTRDWAARRPSADQDAAAMTLTRVQTRIRTALGIGRRPSSFRPSS
ncbi:hypothetical protein GCM10009801_77990 [Streptomyces albiaxialis]|uniref:Uncharacterized protein n=1 Tax=Streptomyces albiaxialis TaxID=329523 RepID=A0ABP5IN15_9ACTN